MLILDMNHVNRCSRWHNNCRLSLVFMPRGHFLLLAGVAGDRAPQRLTREREQEECHIGARSNTHGTRRLRYVYEERTS
jgi:hypothetical protein